MCWGSLSLLVAACCIFLQFYGVNSAATFLLEKPESPTNSSHLLAKVNEAARNENERVSEKMLLTKDKEVRDAWRKEKEDLVELEKAAAIEKKTAEVDGNHKIVGETVILPASVTLVDPQVADHYTGTRISHRMKRTFWPFTGLFGYDDYPPSPPYGNYGMFGPSMIPPFGGGGFGMGYPRPYGPFGPPPPLFGLEFDFF